MLITPEQCLATGGDPRIGMHSCYPNPCLLPDERACCFEGKICELLLEEECLSAGGVYQGTWPTCNPNPCELSQDLTGGCFISHYVEEIGYSSDPPTLGWCDEYRAYHAIADASEQVNRIETTSYLSVSWYILAAWNEAKEVCGIEFGFGDYDERIFGFQEYAPCYPPESGLALTTPGWPGPNEGISSVTVGRPWGGNYIPVMWFGGYAYGYHGAGVIELDIDPPTQFAGFSNCTDPPIPFEVPPERRGGLGINMDGIYVEPLAVPLYVCCLPDYSCDIRTYDDCLASGGALHPELTSCDPNPCGPAVPGACCLGPPYAGGCEVMVAELCDRIGGHWIADETCDPNPCPQECACCYPDSTCVLLFPDECLTAGGEAHPEWSFCEPNPCLGPVTRPPAARPRPPLFYTGFEGGVTTGMDPHPPSAWGPGNAGRAYECQDWGDEWIYSLVETGYQWGIHIFQAALYYLEGTQNCLGLIFHAQDLENHYLVVLHDGSTCTLYVREEGVLTELATAPYAYDPEHWYALRIEAASHPYDTPHLKVSINGERLINIADQTHLHGTSGLAAKGTRAWFDNVVSLLPALRGAGDGLLSGDEITPHPDAPLACTRLLSARPNPFSGSVEIAFELAQAAQARVRILDTSGRVVRTLVDGDLAGGEHRIQWHGRASGGHRVQNGIYLCTFESGEVRETRKLFHYR